MFGGPAMSNDLNLPFPSSPFRHQQGNHNKQQQQDEHEHLHRQQHHMSSNLLRYRSAPTSVLGGDAAAACAEEFLRAGPQVTEAESMFARFMAPPDHPMGEKHHHQNGPANPMHAAAAAAHGHPQMLFQLHQQHPPSMQGLGSTDVTAQFRIDDDEHGGGGAKGGAGVPGLARHSSSPAGLTPHLNVENGFGGSSRVGSNGAAGFRPCSNGTAERLKTQISFSSRGPSGSSTFLSQISELGPTGDGSSDEGGGSGGERCYMPAGFPVATWEDSVLLSESFKRVRDPSEMQNGVSVSLAMGGGGGGGAGAGGGGPVRSLSGDVERYLQFQDAVPCKVRAKRGCATHPRSIAERVRRTRISERIRKLQELVPNMDKQTNTADMLDLAVEYIKELQKQAKVLSDDRANCTCNSNGRQ